MDYDQRKKNVICCDVIRMQPTRRNWLLLQNTSGTYWLVSHVTVPNFTRNMKIGCIKKELITTFRLLILSSRKYYIKPWPWQQQGISPHKINLPGRFNAIYIMMQMLDDYQTTNYSASSDHTHWLYSGATKLNGPDKGLTLTTYDTWTQVRSRYNWNAKNTVLSSTVLQG